MEIIKNATPLDVLLLISDYGSKFDFHFLVSASKCRGHVIYSGCFDNFKFHKMFGFTLIRGHFHPNDLLQALSSKNNISRNIHLPRITEKERQILFQTWSGTSISDIAKIMSLGPKTVYQHQRNVLDKIGIRKARDLYLLPENFVEYIYQAHVC
nr:helix-turn-helix transcriptional regulator [Citrobacter farmeri]